MSLYVADLPRRTANPPLGSVIVACFQCFNPDFRWEKWWRGAPCQHENAQRDTHAHVAIAFLFVETTALNMLTQNRDNSTNIAPANSILHALLASPGSRHVGAALAKVTRIGSVRSFQRGPGECIYSWNVTGAGQKFFQKR
ncbi:MAG: hypothetical protein V4542_05665 [Pseudomonadota bacterium]